MTELMASDRKLFTARVEQSEPNKVTIKTLDEVLPSPTWTP